MKKEINKKIFKIIKIIIITIIIILIINEYKKIETDNYNNKYQTERTISTTDEQTVENLEEKSRKVTDILEETTYKIVGISKLKDIGNSIFSDVSEKELGLGTGFIVSENGYIVSNEHVTGEEYSNCYITLENGKNYDGKVVWSDKDLDLSIVKIEAKNLPFMELGNSKTTKIGEKVFAIGNPIGFEFRRTVTSGIISGKNRTIKIEEKNKKSYMTDLIQTDATINPGNSGGPLILSNGEVIGINTIKITTAEGIGFAIPIDIIKPIIKKLKESGKFEEPTLGIYAYDKEVIPYLSPKNKFNKGIYIVKILKGGPADKKEIKEGDIITKINDVEIETLNDLREYIYSKNINDEVTLNIVNGKISKEVKIRLKKKQKS